MEYKYVVLIGRFQLEHNGHVDLFKHGLSIAEKIIILIGSVNSARTIKNPFTFEERKKMILDSLPTKEHSRIEIRGIRDFHYNENAWIADIQAKTDEFISEGDSVAITGEYKDGSSYYLKHFPQWDFVPLKSAQRLDATDLRRAIFNVDPKLTWEGLVANPANLAMIKDHVPENVAIFLRDFMKSHMYADLVQEYNFISEYKKKWANAPFPPTFTTVDSVVICSGHILVVERKFNPGKGLLALPGGFIKADERIVDACVRELKEETGIRVEKRDLYKAIKDDKVFDYPARSLRGRTITHAFYVKLDAGKLPEVRGNDDAAKAIWMPIMDVFKEEHRFFEDHAHIIQYFTMGGK